MIEDNLRRFSLHSKDWGEIKILRPKVGGWGALEPLKGTPIGDNLSQVSGEVLSVAMKGHVTPLMNVIGPVPALLLRRFKHLKCRHKDACVMHTKECVPTHKKMPLCFEPLTPDGVLEAAAIVILAWHEGYFVMVVTGDEFA